MTFVLPEYEGMALNNLLPSILARLEGRHPTIEIPHARQYVIVLIDGLGHHLLREYANHADRVAGLPSQRLTCGVPSTTAASLMSLGCGCTPGRHGVVGYTFVEPTLDAVVHALTWENGPDDIEGFRQEATLFRRMASAGHPSAAVTLGRFADSALTRLGFDGTDLFPRPDEGAEVEETVEVVRAALATHEVVYCYERLLDFTGHGFGVGSWQWLEQLERIDDLVAGIATLAGPDVCVLVTGDHGMVNVPSDHRLTIEDEPRMAGYRHIAGEGRFRQIHADDPRHLAWQWRSVLGERAEVLLRDEAIERGWFGHDITAKAAARVGDVVVAMRDDWALMSTTFEKEFGLVGMHGSLTPDEMYVPLAVTGGR